MSNNIQQKSQMARELAYGELKKLPQYKFTPIPQSVLDAKMNEYMKLTEKELQEKITEFYSANAFGTVGDMLEISEEQQKNNYEQFRIMMSPKTAKTEQANQVVQLNKQMRKLGIESNTPISTLSQSEEEALGFMEEMLQDATQTFETQLKNDNWITKGYNAVVKETFDSEYSKSNVQKALDETQNDITSLKTTVDFKETFKQTRGVEFNEGKIKETKEKAEAMVKYQASSDMVKNLKQKLSSALTNTSGNNISRSGEKAIIETLSSMGYTSIGEVIQTAMKGHENDPAIKNYMKEGGNFAVRKDEDGNVGIYRETKEGGYQPITQEMAQIIGEEIDLRLNKLYAKTLGIPESELEGKSSAELEELTSNKFNELKSDYEQTFAEAYGKKDVKALSENYMLSQQEGQAYIQMGVNFLAMAGAMFSGGGTLGLVSMGTIMTNPVDLIARATDEEGMTKQDWQEYGDSVLEQAGWMALGMGAGKVGDMTRSFVKLKGLQKAFKESGKSFDEFMKLAQMNKDIPQDIAKALRKTKIMSEGLGVTAEVATDLATTYALQKDGATTTDWVMSITSTLAGTATFKQLASKLRSLKSNPSATIQEIKQTFSALDLTDADAIKLHKAISEMEGVNENVGVNGVNSNTQNPNIHPNDQVNHINQANEGIPTVKTKNDNSIQSRLENAKSREDFAAIRDELKAMPAGAEKTSLMEALYKKYNEFKALSDKSDVRMVYKPKEIITKILADNKYYSKIIEKWLPTFLDAIPDEHSAMVIAKYLDTYKDKDFQSEKYYRVISDLNNNPENIKEFVRIIESQEISEELKTPDSLFNRCTLFGEPTHFQPAVTYEKLVEITNLGLGKKRPISSIINFEEINSIMQLEPEQRDFISKIYTSKLFSKIEFWKLLSVDKEMIDFDKLSRIDSIMDDFSLIDTFDKDSVYRILAATDEQLDIIEARGLLRKIPDRTERLNAEDIFNLLAIDDATWNIVLERNLLGEMHDKRNGYYLAGREVKTLADLTDNEWNTFKQRGLFRLMPSDIELKNHSNMKTINELKELSADNSFLCKLAKLSDEEFAEVKNMFDTFDNNASVLGYTIRTLDGKTSIDRDAFKYAVKFKPFLNTPERTLTGLYGKDNKIDIELADELLKFVENVGNDEAFGKDCASVMLQERIKTTTTPEGVIVLHEVLGDRKPFTLSEIRSKNEIFNLLKKLNTKFTPYGKGEIIRYTDENSYKFIEQLLTNGRFEFKPRFFAETGEQNFNYLIHQDLNKLQEGVDLQRKRVLETPDRYVNGEYDSEASMIDAVNKFFDEHQGNLLVLSAIYDKEAFNHLLRMRFDDVEEYLYVVKELETPDIELLTQMNKSTNIDGKPFMPTQKVEFIDLLQAYKTNELDIAPIKEMAESGKLDLGKLQIDLFNQIMKKSGLSEDEIASIPKEKLISWDSKYAHLLSKEIQECQDAAFSDILRHGSLEPNFMKYLHDTDNVYGKTNAKTMAIFEESGLNYNKWINSSKENEIHFVSRDANQEKLSQVATQLTEDIGTLRSGPVKGFIDKQFPHCIKDGKFVLPTEAIRSKAKLNEFVSNLIKQLDSVWKRAEGNLTNPDPKRSQTARNTLTILNHFNQRIDDISQISEDKITKSLDWTIKMWDRNPQKDIFQGNYSTCCIAMGGGNGSAMPHFVMDTAYNMIELVDNNSGKTVGNALCYFIKDKDGNPAFIIDNIEINNGVKPSDEVGIQLRTQMAEYASNIAKEVTGKENVSIYMSGSYNDVPCSNLPKHKEEVSFLGDVDCDQIYMDLYGGWVNKDRFTSKATLLKLK